MDSSSPSPCSQSQAPVHRPRLDAPRRMNPLRRNPSGARTPNPPPPSKFSWKALVRRGKRRDTYSGRRCRIKAVRSKHGRAMQQFNDSSQTGDRPGGELAQKLTDDGRLITSGTRDHEGRQEKRRSAVRSYDETATFASHARQGARATRAGLRAAASMRFARCRRVVGAHGGAAHARRIRLAVLEPHFEEEVCAPRDGA